MESMDLLDQELISCENCKIPFDSELSSPMILPCGHTLCNKCLNSIWKRWAFVKCPFDNKKHFNDLKTYGINHLVMSIVHNYSEKSLNQKARFDANNHSNTVQKNHFSIVKRKHKSKCREIFCNKTCKFLFCCGCCGLCKKVCTFIVKFAENATKIYNIFINQLSKLFTIIISLYHFLINNPLIDFLTKSQDNIFLHYFRIIKEATFRNFDISSEDNYFTKITKLFIYISLVFTRVLLIFLIHFLLLYYRIFLESFVFVVLSNETVYSIWRNEKEDNKVEKTLKRWKYFFNFIIANQFYFYYEEGLFTIICWIWKLISISLSIYITSNFI